MLIYLNIILELCSRLQPVVNRLGLSRHVPVSATRSLFVFCCPELLRDTLDPQVGLAYRMNTSTWSWFVGKSYVMSVPNFLSEGTDGAYHLNFLVQEGRGVWKVDWKSSETWRRCSSLWGAARSSLACLGFRRLQPELMFKHRAAPPAQPVGCPE